jgi:hypothetical protein
MAVVLPMPEVPPVTSATFPENLLLFIVFLSFLDAWKSDVRWWAALQLLRVREIL